MNTNNKELYLLIRPASVTDATALSQLMATLFWDSYHTENTPENMYDYMQKSFGVPQQTAELADPHRITFVVEQDDTLIAYAQLSSLYSEPSATAPLPENGLFLSRFYVHKNWHGRGIALPLLQKCEQYAQAQSIASIWFTVWQQNKKAIAFYQKHGFVVFGTANFTVGDDVQTDWLMQKSMV